MPIPTRTAAAALALAALALAPASGDAGPARAAGTTERVNVGPGGAQADDHSYYPKLSADGLFVAFWSAATNLVPGDTNGADDVFVRTR